MKINFSCDEHLLGAIPNPVPAIKKCPDYFKKIKPQITENPEHSTVKRCTPFLDALSVGYILPLWCDVFVSAKHGEININFPKDFAQKNTIGTHNINQMPDHPLSRKRYGDILLKWVNPWIIQTDPGVSCMFVSPLNHLEPRLKILDGVVDTDTYYNNINFPFIWTGGDGQFILERGTPLVQVIPFRRENSSLEVSCIDQEKKEKTCSILGTKLKNGYRDEFWHNKKLKTEQSDIFPDEMTTDGHVEAHVEKSVLVEANDRQEEWKTELPSAIPEVDADNESRGFGEGGF